MPYVDSIYTTKDEQDYEYQEHIFFRLTESVKIN